MVWLTGSPPPFQTPGFCVELKYAHSNYLIHFWKKARLENIKDINFKFCGLGFFPINMGNSCSSAALSHLEQLILEQRF